MSPTNPALYDSVILAFPLLLDSTVATICNDHHIVVNSGFAMNSVLAVDAEMNSAFVLAIL